jgi:hypothetical protein
LQNAAEALQDIIGIFSATSRSVDEGNTGWIITTPRPVITRECSEVTGFSFAFTRVKHRRTGFIHIEFG